MTCMTAPLLKTNKHWFLMVHEGWDKIQLLNDSPRCTGKGGNVWFVVSKQAFKMWVIPSEQHIIHDSYLADR